MPRLKRDESVRINLEVSPLVRERIERLKDTTGAESLTEVIRRALAVYETLLSLSQDGRTVIVREQDGDEADLVLIP